MQHSQFATDAMSDRLSRLLHNSLRVIRAGMTNPAGASIDTNGVIKRLVLASRATLVSPDVSQARIAYVRSITKFT